jgi:hypothetical protein
LGKGFWAIHYLATLLFTLNTYDNALKFPPGLVFVLGFVGSTISCLIFTMFVGYDEVEVPYLPAAPLHFFAFWATLTGIKFGYFNMLILATQGMIGGLIPTVVILGWLAWEQLQLEKDDKAEPMRMAGVA